MLKKRDNIEDLEHEADILYPLRHQNVVEFLGICLNPPALVTELLLVGDLRSFLRKISDGIDYRQRLRYMILIRSFSLVLAWRWMLHVEWSIFITSTRMQYCIAT